MANPKYKLIDIHAIRKENGTLTMIQGKDGVKNSLSFDIKRVFIISDMRGSDVRGGHTHHKTVQVLMPISGGCTVTMDDGTDKEVIQLFDPEKGLLIPPYVWHTMQDFAEGTVLIDFADTIYDEKDYIRNYDDFISIIKRK